MEFKGGTIIIGSLLWDKSSIREKWRSLCLNEISTKTPVKMKIRYGRKSQSRQDTYSMIFSNHPKTEFGQAYVLGFKEVIKNARILESQAFALASAEGIWGKEPSLNKSWGTVGLLINPNIDKKDKVGADIIRKRWADIYLNYKDVFKSSEYSVENEDPVIDQYGFLNIEWTEEMNDYDFLIATPVVSNTKGLLNAQQIAEKMIEKNYFEYFKNNVDSGIMTFQDDEILELLEKEKGSH